MPELFGTAESAVVWQQDQARGRTDFISIDRVGHPLGMKSDLQRHASRSVCVIADGVQHLDAVAARSRHVGITVLRSWPEDDFPLEDHQIA